MKKYVCKGGKIFTDMYDNTHNLYGQKGKFMFSQEKNCGRIFGYARVSTKEQNLDRQLLALQEYVPKENIIVDKLSGKDLERPGYLALKGPLGLRSGDTLVVQSLDRLSRNKNDIMRELRYFLMQGISIKIIDIPTTMQQFPEEQKWIGDMINSILIEVLASIAEQERLTIRKRQREGIDAAKMKGTHLGRPKIDFPKEWEMIYLQWKAGTITAKCAMEQLGMKRSSFYKLVKKYENNS